MLVFDEQFFTCPYKQMGLNPFFTKHWKPENEKVFVVKIQYVPGQMKDLFTRPEPAESIVIYNQDRSFQCQVPKECPNFKSLEKAILTKGIWGVKGYFHVKWSEDQDRLYVDMDNVIPYLDW